MSFNLPSDYNDVPGRIADFRAKYPEGSLTQKSLTFEEVAGGWWVVYTCAAYRTPDDQRPGEGTAWEPVPGKTPYTRDSEVQNAETAAWGRAIVATLAADTKKGIASAEEVRNRRAEEPAPKKKVPPKDARAVLREEATKAGYTDEEFDTYIDVTYPKRTLADLTPDDLNAAWKFFHELWTQRDLNEAIA